MVTHTNSARGPGGIHKGSTGQSWCGIPLAEAVHACINSVRDSGGQYWVELVWLCPYGIEEGVTVGDTPRGDDMQKGGGRQLPVC